MKRKILSLLERWKSSPLKKPLLIKGARQVGKTYIINEFANANYEKNRIIRINFEEQPQMEEVFSSSLDADSILGRLSQRPEFRNIDFRQDAIHPLFLFLDEIQKCAKAITALKFLSSANSYLHVIGSGSLLGVALGKGGDSSYPVGYVEQVELFPLDFEEFMWAFDYSDSYISSLKQLVFEPNAGSLVEETVHQKLMELFRLYIVVGGMPEAVRSYLETRTFAKVRAIQQQLITGYNADIQKYVNGRTQQLRVSEIFRTIPQQLKNTSHKFKFAAINKNAKSREFADPLSWLILSGLVVRCENLKRVEEPIESFSKETDFKLYLFDTGLLLSQLSEDDRYSVLQASENNDIGGIYENAVATILHQYHGGVGPLHYYHENDRLEIDFVDRIRRGVILIEVKPGSNLKSASLNNMMDRNIERVSGLKVSGKLVKQDGKEKNLPFYLFALLLANNHYLPLID